MAFSHKEFVSFFGYFRVFLHPCQDIPDDVLCGSVLLTKVFTSALVPYERCLLQEFINRNVVDESRTNSCTLNGFINATVFPVW